MDNVIVLGNGLNIDLGLKTTFKAFRESFEFRSIADIPLIKKIRDNQWSQSMEFMQMLTILYGVHFKNKLYEYRATKDRIQESAKDSNWG